MGWHSVTEACHLARRSRRSLYRDMAAGRVSYDSDVQGQRVIETSELIRAYGDLAQVALPEIENLAQPVTASGTPEKSDHDAQIVALVAQVEQLNRQMENMRGELQEYQRLLTHQPEESPPKRPGFLQRLRYLFSGKD